MTKQIMIDLETLGTGHNCVVVSIGAKVLFQDGEGAEFYRRLDWSQQVNEGRIIEPGTVKWWLRQEDDAQRELIEHGEDVKQVLTEFRDFCGVFDDCIVWANGSLFDLAILRSLYNDMGVSYVAPYYNEFCFRTLVKFLQQTNPSYEIKELECETSPSTSRETLAHHALGDAKRQAYTLEHIYNEVFKPVKTKVKKQVEKEKPQVELSVDDIRTAFKDFAKKEGTEKALELLNSFGAKSVSGIEPKDYKDVMIRTGGGDV